MKTTILSVLGLGTALALAGCRHVGSGICSTGNKSGLPSAGQCPATSSDPARVKQTHVIKIDHEQQYEVAEAGSRSRPQPISAATNYWALKENYGEGNGALRNMPVETDDLIKWHLEKSEGFSIVVTNINEWKIVEGETSDFLTNGPCPFNARDHGYVNAVKRGQSENRFLKLRFLGSHGITNYGYWIAVPEISATQVKARQIPNYENMIEATLIWDGSKTP